MATIGIKLIQKHELSFIYSKRTKQTEEWKHFCKFWKPVHAIFTRKWRRDLVSGMIHRSWSTKKGSNVPMFYLKKKFKWKTWLVQHMIKICGEMCERICVNRSALFIHNSVHNMGVRFIRKSVLKHHMICNKFDWKDQLNSHMKIHTGSVHDVLQEIVIKHQIATKIYTSGHRTQMHRLPQEIYYIYLKQKPPLLPELLNLFISISNK